MKPEKETLENILKEADAFLHKNDYISAEKYLLSHLSDSEIQRDLKKEILIRNELMGLYRKLGQKNNSLEMVSEVLKTIKNLGAENQVGSATTYLNCATVYKAFGMAEKAIPLFTKAKDIYEKNLDAGDVRLGGLYNNMALALVDLKRYREAEELYKKALEVVLNHPESVLDGAITYLNMANAVEYEYGLENAIDIINDYLNRAEDILENYPVKDGYYAFVCEKCASVYGYYGYFLYEGKLLERARMIYERS